MIAINFQLMLENIRPEDITTFLMIVYTILFGILSLFVLIFFIIYSVFSYKDHLDFAEVRLQKTFNDIQNWSIERFQRHYNLLKFLIAGEFFGLFAGLLFIIYFEIWNFKPNSVQILSIQQFFYKPTESYIICGQKLYNFSREISISIDRISIAVVILSGLIIYCYFFEMLRQNHVFKKASENQKAYFSFFSSLLVLTSGYTVFIVAVDLITGNVDFIKQILPLTIGWINIILLIPFPVLYEKKAATANFIQEFNKLKKEDINKDYSSYILFSTFMAAIIGYILDFDLLLVLFFEISLLLIHYWSNKFLNLPERKSSIELIQRNPSESGQIIIDNVYIVDDSETESITIISEGDIQKRIMKSSIVQIIPHQDETRR